MIQQVLMEHGYHYPCIYWYIVTCLSSGLDGLDNIDDIGNIDLTCSVTSDLVTKCRNRATTSRS